MEQFTKEQFCDYVKDHVLGFLPPSFEGAEIELKVITKANDIKLTGMLIRREGEAIVPNIYLESYYDKYKSGEDLDKLVGDVADTRIEYNRDSISISPEMLKDYEFVRPYLQIRLCDPETNKDRLSGLVSTPVGDYAATYIVKLENETENLGTLSVTPELMEIWGVTAEELHADALAADVARTPALNSVTDLLMEYRDGSKAANLLKGETPKNVNPFAFLGGEIPTFDSSSALALYCLSVDDKAYGASLLANESILQQVGEALGENYFVLPSSIHKLMIVPESNGASAADLVDMVTSINETEVLPEEVLSNKVHYYDRETGVLVNAVKREKDLETKRDAERPSLSEQLSQKKEEVRNRPPKPSHVKPRDEVSL
ncbi:MAG: DUF5688 family protein [Lachnospiraceae bacterium]|nr:DUF5688 family protein [Lachnospiraceae bacterium]